MTQVEELKKKKILAEKAKLKALEAVEKKKEEIKKKEEELKKKEEFYRTKENEIKIIDADIVAALLVENNMNMDDLAKLLGESNTMEQPINQMNTESGGM
ncbi:hypothetical protein KZ114_002388 [Enterococcus faecalis]|uniref:hypothetical protein n=1 Tax=Enterococcus faecalis TaxID=1351 RepID=UPI00045B593A|nr:hypothetical protein [Enterococcus faecalis]EHV0179366.1 hypothetical protein [Enterococcus faecalis]KAJ85620.1 hypothetical protein P791_1219 [Enterococcus faecalis NY9]